MQTNRDRIRDRKKIVYLIFFFSVCNKHPLFLLVLTGSFQDLEEIVKGQKFRAPLYLSENFKNGTH